MNSIPLFCLLKFDKFELFVALSNAKRTATGPDEIPFWIWKDYADVFAPVITTIWNDSLRNSEWPTSWREANVQPLPKVETPIECSHFSGINITPVIARNFEKTVYQKFAKHHIESHLSNTHFAYRTGGNCTDALLTMQHFILCALDDPNTTAVRLFSMDFSKAFDSVKHSILTQKLKKWPCLNPRVVNWYIAFLNKRKQRVVHQGVACEWKSINKGTVQGSVSGPHLFNVFMNDLESDNSNDTSLIKFADDSNIAVVVRKNQPDPSERHVENFKTWSGINCMSCNLPKCKSLSFAKKSQRPQFSPVCGIAEFPKLKILGMTFQSNCTFSHHLSEKLKEANKCLFVLRLRKEGCTQDEIDCLFKTFSLAKSHLRSLSLCCQRVRSVNGTEISF